MSWQSEYRKWLQDANLVPYLKEQLQGMEHNKNELEAAFSSPMEFGTAGMRGVIGPGINRMNIYTVRQATEGLARFMDTLSPTEKQRGVAISFDPRHHSTDFAHEVARVLGMHQIPVYLFDSLRPTPELSFAVRYLKTYAGVMITASHNPKQYNGYKIYGPDGGQMPPEDADKITSYIRKVTDIFHIAVEDEERLKADNLLTIIGEDVDEAYLAGVESVTINKDLVQTVGKDMKLVYTPLNGTGKMLVERALKQAGYEQFKIVPEQADPDPDFSTTPFPNPEFPQTFDLAKKIGQAEGADLLIATDPDADRLGAAVRLPNGEYQLLTGNQLGSLMLHYILKAHQAAGTLPANAVAVKSIVSTELATKVATSFNVEMINVLTGFKFIAEQIQHFEDNASHTFMFGFEESYGYLINPFVRDKDAVQASVLLAEIAAYYKSQGKTLYDGINDLYAEYGYYAEKTTSLDFEGVHGQADMAKLMKTFREETPKVFGGVKVEAVEDFQAQTIVAGNGDKSETGLPAANVLKYILTDETWIAIRPSGTEPKVKFYIGTSGTAEKDVQAKLANFEKAIHTYTKQGERV